MLGHVIGALNKADQVSVFAQDKDGWSDGVHGYDVAFAADGKTSHDVDKANWNPTNEMARRTKDLHSRSLVATIADHKVARIAEDGHLTRVP